MEKLDLSASQKRIRPLSVFLYFLLAKRNLCRMVFSFRFRTRTADNQRNLSYAAGGPMSWWGGRRALNTREKHLSETSILHKFDPSWSEILVDSKKGSMNRSALFLSSLSVCPWNSGITRGQRLFSRFKRVNKRRSLWSGDDQHVLLVILGSDDFFSFLNLGWKIFGGFSIARFNSSMVKLERKELKKGSINRSFPRARTRGDRMSFVKE